MKTAFPPLPPGTKEVDRDFELTDEEKMYDAMEFERVSSGPEFEAFKQKLMNATFEEIPATKPNASLHTVRIPDAMLEKFKKTMDKAHIPYYL